MQPTPRAHKEKKKVPFLKALARLGGISKASKAIRISRDAVHDWRRNDPAFAASFLLAKKAFKEKPETLSIDDALVFFTDALRRVVPDSIWARVHSRMQIAVSERKFRARGRSDSQRSSRNKEVDVSMPETAIERRANLGQGIDMLHRSF